MNDKHNYHRVDIPECCLTCKHSKGKIRRDWSIRLRDEKLKCGAQWFREVEWFGKCDDYEPQYFETSGKNKEKQEA